LKQKLETLNRQRRWSGSDYRKH